MVGLSWDIFSKITTCKEEFYKIFVLQLDGSRYRFSGYIEISIYFFADEVLCTVDRIWSYSGPHFPASGLNNSEYGHFLRSLAVVEKTSSVNFQYLFFNLFVLNAPFLHLLKTSENRKVEKGYIGNKWVNIF